MKILSSLILMTALTVGAQSIPPAPQTVVIVQADSNANATRGALLGAATGALIGGNNHHTLAGVIIGGSMGWIIGHTFDHPQTRVIGTIGNVPTGDYAVYPYVVYGPVDVNGYPVYIDEWVWLNNRWSYQRWGWYDFNHRFAGRRVLVGRINEHHR